MLTISVHPFPENKSQERFKIRCREVIDVSLQMSDNLLRHLRTSMIKRLRHWLRISGLRKIRRPRCGLFGGDDTGSSPSHAGHSKFFPEFFPATSLL